MLQDGLERSIELAAAMDSRGFGRRGPVSRIRRRLTTGAVLVGLLAVASAIYGVLDTGSPAIVGLPLMEVARELGKRGIQCLPETRRQRPSGH